METVENPFSDAKLENFHLGVFAKQPIPGQVKTRLSPPLSFGEAAELYEVALAETLARCQAAGLAPVLFYAGDRSYFATTFADVELAPQAAGDLGCRLHDAMSRLLGDSACRGAALIGSDSPDLPIAVLQEAFTALQTSDCVIAPAGDGGYVLIAMRRLCGELFAGIPWSSSEVLATTRQKARHSGLSYREVSGWDDVDDLHSLHRLLNRSPDSRTARFAARRLAEHFADR